MFVFNFPFLKFFLNEASDEIIINMKNNEPFNQKNSKILSYLDLSLNKYFITVNKDGNVRITVFINGGIKEKFLFLDKICSNVVSCKF